MDYISPAFDMDCYDRGLELLIEEIKRQWEINFDNKINIFITFLRLPAIDSFLIQRFREWSLFADELYKIDLNLDNTLNANGSGLDSCRSLSLGRPPSLNFWRHRCLTNYLEVWLISFRLFHSGFFVLLLSVPKFGF